MGGCLEKSELMKDATAAWSSHGASFPVPIRRNPLGRRWRWRWQRQFRERNPLPRLARPADCNKLVVFGDIDASTVAVTPRICISKGRRRSFSSIV